MVRQELQAKLGDKVKDLSGVKIFTTFDSVAQDAAEKAAVEGIPVLKKQRKLSDPKPRLWSLTALAVKSALWSVEPNRSLRAITVRCRRVVRLVLWPSLRPI